MKCICNVMLLLAVFLCVSVTALAQTANPTLNEAIALHCEGKVAEAIDKYSQVANTSTTPTEIRHALFAIGACQLSLQRYDDAVTSFVHFAEDFPDDYQAPLALAHAGNCLAEQGRFLEAEPYYLRALQFEQSQENTRYWIGWAFLGMGKVLMFKQEYADARLCLQQALNRAAEEKVTKEATALLEQCPATTTMPMQSKNAREVLAKANFAIGNVYYEEMKYDKALPFIKRAISGAKDPNVLAEAYDHAAECLYYLHQPDDASASADAIEELADADTLTDGTDAVLAKSTPFHLKKGDWVLKAKRWKVRTLMTRGLNAEAIQVCEDLVSRYSNADQGYVKEMLLLKANALMNSGNLDAALSIARDIRAQNASEVWNLTADALVGDYLLQAKNYSGAASAYLKVVNQPISNKAQSRETKAGAMYTLASCYRHLGQFSRTRDYLEEIINSYSDTTWKKTAQNALANWMPAASDPSAEGLR